MLTLDSLEELLMHLCATPRNDEWAVAMQVVAAITAGEVSKDRSHAGVGVAWTYASTCI